MKHTRIICLLLLFLLLPALVACQTPEEALLSQAKAAIEDGEFETAHELLSALPEEPDAQDLLRRFEWTWGSESTVSTARVTSAAASGWVPKLMPPPWTLGQETFTSSQPT